MNTQNTTYHLSHIDLDGYSCQLITNELFNTIIFFNSNYGQEVSERLEQILSLIDASDEDANILISDLNLTFKESKFLDAAVKERNSDTKKVHLLLLDHHGSGQDSADEFAWYDLDTKRCATKIVYDYALANWDIPKALNEWLEPFVNIVNAVDLWKMEETENFEYGKVCMRLVTETRELNRYIFDQFDRDYKFALLKEAASMSQVENAPIILDEKIHKMKKAFFTINKDNTLDGLATAYVVDLVGKLQDTFSVNFRGYKGI
ncbi:MAG: phosphoesterase, partial [Thiovulaceae bacterium]|nr:phosphoesterase [Sulfurimonadaceae bacterium]